MKREKESANEQVKKLFKKRGLEALEIARKAVLEEKIESKEIREALRYFMMEYWHDVARPGLLSIVCESVGGNAEAVTDVAIPLVLISGAADIHDDIIDESKTKYSRPTVYGKFGKDIAILAGDALFFKGLNMLNLSCLERPQIVDIVKDMFFELGDAEALELQLRRKTTVLPETCLRIIRKKAADVEAHARIGAIKGGGTKKQIDVLGEYGRLLGMLIILKDDYIDSLEHEELENRIMKEHFPLPIIYALQQGETSTKLVGLLKKRNLNKIDLDNIIKMTTKSKGFQHVTKTMNEIAAQAKSILNSLKEKRTLRLVVNSLIEDL